MSRPAQIRFLSLVARAYDPFVRMAGFPALWRAVAEAAAPVRGESALDVCTGTGGVAAELALRGAQVTGIDLAAGMLRQARYKLNGTVPSTVRLSRMDARQLGFRDRSFSLVTCAMALHEMSEEERARVLREIARVASNRVLIAEYRVPPQPGRSVAFRARHLFEYLESDDFESFVRTGLESRIDGAGFGIAASRDVGRYRILQCRVRDGRAA